MSYYTVLGLNREPFSTSPDPSFFYLSKDHKAALYRLQIAISLKRGLCVILGDVGTGKTTLSRKFCQMLREEPDVSFHMVLNPYFKTQKQFLMRLAALFHLDLAVKNPSALDCIEGIEHFLYRRGVQEQKNVVLLIDEAQLLSDDTLEILRILLNYETNEYKILQLVLVGQLELLPRLRKMHNLWDRIALRYVINPLGLDETAEMIRFRLEQAGFAGSEPIFTDGAVWRIYEATGGYPRKLAWLCHYCLETLVMQDRKVVDEDTVRVLIEKELKNVALTAGGSADGFR